MNKIPNGPAPEPENVNRQWTTRREGSLEEIGGFLNSLPGAALTQRNELAFIDHYCIVPPALGSLLYTLFVTYRLIPLAGVKND